MYEPRPADIELPDTQPIDLSVLVTEAVQREAAKFSTGGQAASR